VVNIGRRMVTQSEFGSLNLPPSLNATNFLDLFEKLNPLNLDSNTFGFGNEVTENLKAAAEAEAVAAQENLEHPATGAAGRRAHPESSRLIAVTAARVCADNNGSDIVILDMTRHTAIFDYFVIATGTSRRQLHAMAEDINQRLKKELKEKRMQMDGYDESRWIVLDYGTVVIHLFDEETRQFYSLEALWGDAEKVSFS
jgi:ribosome-associated protein